MSMSFCQGIVWRAPQRVWEYWWWRKIGHAKVYLPKHMLFINHILKFCHIDVYEDNDNHFLSVHTFLFDFLCKTDLDAHLWNVNSKNGKAKDDVMPLLLLTSFTFMRHLTKSTSHRRSYMIKRGIRKKLRSLDDEHHKG